MTSPSTLCEYCEPIPLEPHQLDIELDLQVEVGGSARWELGTVGRVRSSNCRLCRLVSMTLYHESRLRCASPVPGNHQVELSWGGSRFLGYEPVFTIKVNQPGNQYGSYEHVIRIYIARVASLGGIRNPPSCPNPDRGEALDIVRARQWIEGCLRSHPDCNVELEPVRREEDPEVDPQGRRISDSHGGLQILRLLDVQDNCLIETVDSVKYVALSYLWGLAVNVRLTTANYQALVHRPGSLGEYWDTLPRTIQDAITFVRAIGGRYLWCDALCLIQNDNEDIQRGLESMDYIYEQARFTIVGACGHDADAGLPGVLPGSRLGARDSGILDEIVPGIVLGLDISLDLSLKPSSYRSRGWTFQEEVLSRRLVYFVDNRVYFRCQYTIGSENEDHSPHRKPSDWSDSFSRNQGHPLIRLTAPVLDFAGMLEIYSRRALTYQTDALNAMKGIVRRVSDRMKCGFIEGIPRSAVELIIRFKRAPRSHLRRRENFPSYSWTGWRGSMKVLRHNEYRREHSPSLSMNRWLTTETWIIWYARSPDGTCSLVWDPDTNRGFPWDDPEYVGSRVRMPLYLPGVVIEADRTHPTIDVSCKETLGDSPIRRYHLLQFWTLSVFLQLREIDIQNATALVFDATENQICGFLCIDGLEDTGFWTSGESINPQRSFELILLSSITRGGWWVFHEFLGAERGEELRARCSNWMPFYDVMVLEWMGNVAERRGVGYIMQSAVLHSLTPGPVWKEIVLG